MNDIDTSSVAEVSMMILGFAEKRNRWHFTSKCDVFIAALRIALRLSSAKIIIDLLLGRELSRWRPAEINNYYCSCKSQTKFHRQQRKKKESFLYRVR